MIACSKNCGWEAHQTFYCPCCQTRLCYCEGHVAEDGFDDLCDVCWYAVTHSRIAAIVAAEIVAKRVPKLRRALLVEQVAHA